MSVGGSTGAAGGGSAGFRRGGRRFRVGRLAGGHRRRPLRARTLLVEKLPFLGGNSTAVLDTFYGFYTPGAQARKVVGGIGDDVVAGLRASGPVVERPNTYGAGTGVTYLAEHLKVVWEQLVVEPVRRSSSTGSCRTSRSSDGRITGDGGHQGGVADGRARNVVDASGDADVCHHAGFGYELAGDRIPPRRSPPPSAWSTSTWTGGGDRQGRAAALMARRRKRRLRPPRRGGQRSHHPDRRDDGDHHDQGRARRGPGRHGVQRHRPRCADRGRDGGPPSGAGVRPVPR